MSMYTHTLKKINNNNKKGKITNVYLKSEETKIKGLYFYLFIYLYFMYTFVCVRVSLELE